MLFMLGCFSLTILALLKVIQKLTIGRDDSNACLIGKTAIVTGGKGGMGYEIAAKLASRGCKVIIADVQNAEESAENIIKQTNNKNISYKCIDLGSFRSVRKFAEEINQGEDRLDILVNNVGSVGFEGVYTDDGNLKSHQVNYLGPFLLTQLLVDLLKKTPDSRIVFVSSLLSFTHNLSSINDINKPAKTKFKYLESIVDYSNNKLCVLIAARKFAEKLKKHGISCSSLHPGIVKTKFVSSTFKNSINTIIMNIGHAIIETIFIIYAKTPFEGAQTALYCALSPDVKKITGGFYSDCKEFYCVPPLANNEKFCDELWKESERLCGLKPNEKLD